MRITEGLLLVLLLGVPASGARAGDETLQPFVGEAVLDPRYDVSALKRTMALSVAVQAGRQGSTITLSFIAADSLDGIYHASSSMAVLDAAERAVGAHRINGTLAAVGLGIRLSGGGITFGSRTLPRALTGFSFPFVIGAALDGVAAVLGYGSGVRLRRARLDAGITGVGDLARTCRLSEWTHLVCAVLSTFSAVSQTMVGVSGSDLALFERHREQRAGRTASSSVMVVPAGAGIGIAGRFW